MNKNATIFAIICGLAVAWIANDFAPSFDGAPDRMTGWIFFSIFIILPILSVFGLWLTELIGKKFLFAKQAGKFVLAGAFADVIDIKVFQLLFWLAPFPLFFKGVSFLIATGIKYWINKHWTFGKHEKDDMKKEVAWFFGVTLIGLALNVGSFYYFTKIMGSQFSMPIETWIELSIIFSALVAAVWNFLGYKFIVFKR